MAVFSLIYNILPHLTEFDSSLESMFAWGVSTWMDEFKRM